MKNLKIGIRLSLGFLLVVVLMVAVAAIGTTRLSVLNSGTNDIVNDRAPKVALSNTINEQLSDVAIALRNMIILTDPQQIKAEQAIIDQARKNISEAMSKLEQSVNTPEGRTTYAKLTDARGAYVSGLDRTLKLLADGKKTEAQTVLVSELKANGKAYFDAIEKMKDFQTGMMAKAATSAAETYQTARTVMLGLTAVAVVLSILIALYVSGSITKPIGEAVRIAQTIAGGDLTGKIEVHSKDETGQLLQAMKLMNENLAHVCSQVRAGTATIATASSQIASGNQDLSSRTEQQASSLQQTASSMEELTSTVRQNAENAHQANQLAASASNVAIKGGEVVSQVVETMGAINESSKKMADIINVIDGIAFQTNILALNAAVEAARAGEQGRGFAVVATEVRNLAQRSASAAREIKTLIDDSVGKVETGSKLVEQAGGTMQEVVDSVKRVNDIICEITAASREQSDGIEQINLAVIQMDQVTQQNAALVEEAAAAAEALQDQASSLTNAVSAFKLGALGHAPQEAIPAKLKVVPKTASKPTPEKIAARGNLALAPAGAEWQEY
ncbi:MAG: methyl-accepting chemotaxis protein [Burkholderiaceae bacterium]|nr:methyl-accepting chemotaxis protein [Burkholderiaceae bacterium]